MNLPQATIIICNHNYGKYILDALDSAINQTYPSLQICIIDDGSTDNSWEIIDKALFKNYEHQITQLPSNVTIKQRIDNNRKYSAIKLPNSVGPSYARNIGIESSINETDYYIILDADDIAMPNKVERFVQKFLQFPETGVVYADYDILNIHTGNIIREYKEPYSRNRLLQECIVHSGAGINKQALLAVRDEFGFYDVNLRCAEDFDLWLRISDRFAICHIPESLTFVRVHSENATYSVKNEVWQQCWQRVQAKTQARLSQ